MRCARYVMLCLVSLLTRPAALPGQHGPLLTCDLPPLSSACQVVLPIAQDSVQLNVQVNLPKPAAAPGTSSLVITRTNGNSAELSIAGTGADSRRVTISSTHCCVTPQVADVDPNGYVNVTWRGTQRPKAPVVLTLAAADGGTVRTGTIQITAQPAPPTPEPVAVFTTPYHRTVPRYVWIRGDHIPVTIPVSIDSVGTTVSAGLSDDSARALTQWRTQRYCEQVRVAFTALQGGKASPDSARAMWYPDRDGTRWHPRDGRCVVETRWKLADDAGEQQMNVVVGGDSGIARSQFITTAFARERPRLSGGYGYFAGLRQDRDVACADARERARCTGRADTDTVTIQVREGGGSAYFAVEFPLFIPFARYQVSEGAGVGKYLSEHLRIVLGSTFERPADNIFVGLAILPLFSGASEATPLQLSVGMGGQGTDSWYAGLSLDASTIVGPVLAAIGAK